MHRISRMGLWPLMTLLLVVPAVWVAADGARPISRLHAGVLLYAALELGDPNFLHTVILVVQYNQDGAMGLIINRPSTISLDRALPDLEDVKKLSVPLYIGGPVANEQMLALVRAAASPENSLKIFGNVHATQSRDVLAGLLKQEHPEAVVRVYSGYAGWGPGQLDREWLRGDWKIGRPTPEMIFSDDPMSIWREIFDLPDEFEVRAPAPPRMAVREQL